MRGLAAIVATAGMFAVGVGCGAGGSEPTNGATGPQTTDSKTTTVDERAAREAVLGAERCQAKFSKLIDSLQEVSSRLDVGLKQDEYSDYVGDAMVVYGRIDTDNLTEPCLISVGIPLEKALRAYASAASVWNDCITDLECESDSIDPELQRKWTRASRQIADAKEGLELLREPDSS